MINWSDCSPLTKEEWLDFIKLGIPKLKDLEEKNRWDFFINDLNISTFCDDYFGYCYAINGYPEFWQDNYPKVKDLAAACSIIVNSDWRQENSICYLDKTNTIKIYELILNKVYTITEQLF